MYKGITILLAARLVSNNDSGMKKSSFGWFLGTKGEDRTVLREKRLKFTDYASVKKDNSVLY